MFLFSEYREYKALYLHASYQFGKLECEYEAKRIFILYKMAKQSETKEILF